MLDQTSGRGERRATTIVFFVLLVEALWVFFHKYLPLDAGMWALQADLAAQHMSGEPSGIWKLIPYPAANTAIPYLSGFLSFFMPSEVATRLLMAFGGILLRGMGAVFLCRIMRVRDEAIYYLIPVFIWGTAWFSGALPYLMGEAVALWVIAAFLAQDRPRSNAYWLLTIGLSLVALTHALAFIFAAFVIVAITFEQRRSVHLSQGWLASGRTVMSTLLGGAIICLLSLFGQQPVFTISDTSLLPVDSFEFLVFLATPAPDILEATFRGGDILHGVLAAALTLIILGCFARAFFLAIEEYTWQSRSLKHAGWWLIILALLGVFIRPLGIDLPAILSLSVLVTLIASYSGGPIRRNTLDRALLISSIAAVATAGIINGLSLNRGSEAAVDAYRQHVMLIDNDDEELAQSGQQRRITHFVLDSAYLQELYSGSIVGKINYTAAVPLYMFTSGSKLERPESVQPQGGAMRINQDSAARTSPAHVLWLPRPEDYLDPSLRVLAVLPPLAQQSKTFGRWEFSIIDSNSAHFKRGQSYYLMVAGGLSSERPSGLAQAQ
ncbi:MAG TPA: hypothetical protein VFH43_04410 [Candidatus Kapabacteria bacterium]|nr:hypothetical protein [Candidatus Kapabacteria bacterium]